MINFELSEQRKALKDSISKFAQKEILLVYDRSEAQKYMRDAKIVQISLGPNELLTQLIGRSL